MRQSNTTWPLAFILAIGAQTASGHQAELPNDRGPLAPGSLSGLADRGLQGSGSAASGGRIQRLIDGDRVVQFFPNFRNCITGSWKNC